MNKSKNNKITRIILSLIAASAMAMALQACGSFGEGFKDGWNSTCPEGYEIK